MKHCQKDPSEPMGLANFRNSNPTGTWDQFRNADPDRYHELVEQLQADQRGLCAYCELELSEHNRQVEHFHPKSDTGSQMNWALMWENLWLCCKGGTQTWMKSAVGYTSPLPQNSSCGDHKGNSMLSGQILGPADVPKFPRIYRYQQHPGHVAMVADDPQCAEGEISLEQAANTIVQLNLNCGRLSSARLEVLRKIEQDVKAARTAGINDLGASDLPAKWLSLSSNGHYRQFFTMIRWRFGDAAEQHLLNSGYVG